MSIAGVFVAMTGWGDRRPVGKRDAANRHHAAIKAVRMGLI